MGMGVTCAYQIRGFCLSWNSGLSDPGISWCLEHINCLFGVVRAGPWVQMQTRQPSPSKWRCWDGERRQLLGKALLEQDGLATTPLAQGCPAWWHCSGGKAENIIEKALSNRQRAPNWNPEVCRFLYILMTVFQGEVQANSISAFEPWLVNWHYF